MYGTEQMLTFCDAVTVRMCMERQDACELLPILRMSFFSLN